MSTSISTGVGDIPRFPTFKILNFSDVIVEKAHYMFYLYSARNPI